MSTLDENSPAHGDDRERPWLYRKSTQRLLMGLLLAACALSVAVELFLPGREGKFAVDGMFAFYAILGFISCTLMIFLAKGLGFILKVPTDYYDKTVEDPATGTGTAITAQKREEKHS